MHEYSDSQYKSTVLGLKGGLWVFRKSQKISTASDEYFLSYVKKNYRGLAFYKAENEQKAFCSLLMARKYFRTPTLVFYLQPCRKIWREYWFFFLFIRFNFIDFLSNFLISQLKPNRLSSTISSNREMDQLYTTSQVSNARKTKFSHISWHVFQD